MARKIIIIGGGIAGLSTGCYGRMNGYDTEIFEMHDLPGGVCTGWKRKGYTFDGCLHFLVGTGPGSSLHQVWQELGAFAPERVVDHEVFGDIVLSDGRVLTQYADADRLVASLKEGLPDLDRHDLAALDQLAVDVKHWGTLKIPIGFGPGGPAKRTGVVARASAHIRKIRGMWKIRNFLPLFRRFAGSLAEYTARFHSPDLRSFFTLAFPFPRIAAMSLLMMLTAVHKKEAGWPEGGSLELARCIARRYEELGGVIHYGAKVQKILVRDGRAVGVRVADGSEHFGDEVISAADGHATLFGMLNGTYMSKELEDAYRTLPLYTPLVQVSFGVKRDMGKVGVPRLTTLQLSEPMAMGGTRVPFLLFNNYAFDPTMAPSGKSAISLVFQSPWENWERLAGDRQAYLAEKARVLVDAMAWLEARFPGISADIEASDVATPLTTVRYTGNYHGSYEGWQPVVETMKVKVPKRLPGLANFSMVGQWTAPFAGLPTVVVDGRVVIKEMCAQDDKEFRTWKAGETAETAGLPAIAEGDVAGTAQKESAA
jgi:phytoene dehydrogenase-like protein